MTDQPRTDPDGMDAMRFELERLRRANTVLHRRAQSAESGLAAKLTSGPSFGRALANSAATMYRALLLHAVQRDHAHDCGSCSDCAAIARVVAEGAHPTTSRESGATKERT